MSDIVEFRNYSIFGVIPYSLWKNEGNKELITFVKENKFSIGYDYAIEYPDPKLKLYGIFSCSEMEEGIKNIVNVVFSKEFGMGKKTEAEELINKIKQLNMMIPEKYIGNRSEYDWSHDSCYLGPIDKEFCKFPAVGIEVSWFNTHYDGRDLTEKELDSIIYETKKHYNRCIRFKHRDGRYLTLKETFVKLCDTISDTITNIDVKDDIKQPLSKEQDKYINKKVIEFLIERKRSGGWF